MAGCFQNTISEYVQVASLLDMQQGMGWPHTLRVVEGHEALIKLSKTLQNQQSCEIKTPAGETINVLQLPNSRYERWSDGCGLRVRNVVATDEGRWRITATAQDHKITGWTEVYVEENISTYPTSPISLLDGEIHRVVNLTTLDNSYCLVTQPFSDSSLVSGHCNVTLDRTTRAVQGNWNVLLGIPGQVKEVSADRRVDVEGERLDAGYIHDSASNKLHLYCNIQYSVKNITFCRFQRMSDSLGFNIMDGLSDGSHSYYGNGFIVKHCGLTVEHPTNEDFGTWRCSVGVKQWVDFPHHTENQTPFQALINIPPLSSHNIMAIEHKSNNDVVEDRTIFVQENTSFTISCHAEVSLTYCWFQHPNGTQFTPLPFVHGSIQEFWTHSYESHQNGDCDITFAHVKKEDAGLWTCHMGPRDLGVEITNELNIRVTGPLAAYVDEVSTRIGSEATLYCHSSNGRRPLSYCRFLSPKNIGITIDSAVTPDNAILDRFYFTPDRHLDFGDCSLSINPVLEEDIGEWTCAAVVSETTIESREVIELNVDKTPAPLSQAGIIGMVIGLIILVGVLIGYVGYKRGWKLPEWRNPIRNTEVNLQTLDDQFSIRSTASSNRNIVDFQVGNVVQPVDQL
ncbi:uncharacterized protein LOC131854839 [Achroia grisella]|uniref:uncharacterized protein LOC131854839 n=1 Tax=Achroia grisella TaxID=688607 RepID=UPI0027D331FF|nr:uncharacterized protein LOC131854839 [Achroia grisella]